jgi:hypothetical protein
MPLNALISPNLLRSARQCALWERPASSPRDHVCQWTSVRHRDMWLCLPELRTVCVGCVVCLPCERCAAVAPAVRHYLLGQVAQQRMHTESGPIPLISPKMKRSHGSKWPSELHHSFITFPARASLVH